MENRKQKGLSRVLVLLLAVMMVFTMMPNGMWGGDQTAWAAESENTDNETVKVTFTFDISSFGTESALSELGIKQIPAISVDVPKGTTLQATLQQYVKENEGKTDAVSFVGLDGNGYVTQINDVAAYSNKDAFTAFLANFGIESIPSDFQYAGWMYSGEGLTGLGLSTDVADKNVTVAFRYTLYYAPRSSTDPSDWANFDWEFVDAYNTLTKDIKEAQDIASKGYVDFTDEQKSTLQNKLDAGTALIQEIDNETSGLWANYIAEKMTNLWGPGSPTARLNTAADELNDAIKKTPTPTSITYKIKKDGIIYDSDKLPQIYNGDVLEIIPTVLPEGASQEVTYDAIFGTADQNGVLTVPESGGLAMVRIKSAKASGVTKMVMITGIKTPPTYTATFEAVDGLTFGADDVLQVKKGDQIYTGKLTDGKFLISGLKAGTYTYSFVSAKGNKYGTLALDDNLTVALSGKDNSAVADTIMENIAKTYVDSSDSWKVMEMSAYAALNPNSSYKLSEKAKQNYINLAVAELEKTDVGDTTIDKIVLALTGIGGNVQKIYRVNDNTSISAIEKLNGVSQSTSAWSAPYTLAAYNQGNYEGTEKYESALIDALLKAQKEDGSWDEWGTIDTTANVIAGLAFYKDRKEVADAIEKGINYLSTQQKTSGAFDGGYGENANSTAMVVVGLAAAGVNPDTDSRFVKNGKSALDGLYSFALADNTGFGYQDNTKLNASATEQSFRALIAAAQVMRTGKAFNIYDFSQNKVEPVRATGSGMVETPAEPTGNNITVKMTVKADTGYWINNSYVTIPGTNATVYHAFVKACAAAGITYDGAENGYVKSMTKNGRTLGEFDGGANSGWMYKVNGELPKVGLTTCNIKDGDDIVWFYTNDWTTVPGAKDYMNSTTSVTTTGTSGSAVTTAPTEAKVSEKTNADGTKEKVAEVTVSADNQKEILKQAKEKKSAEIILNAGKDSVKDAVKADIKLDKSFIDSIVKDTDAKLTIKTPFGDKTYTQDELKALSEAATGSTVTVTIEKAAEQPTDDDAVKAEKIAKAKKLTASMQLTARSEKIAKKNVKVTVKTNSKTTASIKELKDLGYTVKYRYYRSAKKAASYKSAVTKSTKTYINTAGTKGKMYYYKAQVRVYDENGKLITKTALKQCKYANRQWNK